MVNSAEVADKWKYVFGIFAPLGHVCRARLAARWLRIHSLPESKRYPEVEADYRELLRRHNDVATAILGEGEACVLFVNSFAEQPTRPGRNDLPKIDGAKFHHVPELATEASDGIWTNVAAALITWRATHFDSLIRSVAAVTVGPILVANFERKAAYAPYDGGADLIVDTTESVALLKKKWRDWLSPRIDGL